ncbi:putative RNA-dependent RNA polymerase 5 [Silene latifolia]|uniref:putative RNA-dependent RNA polymerase 5 n=1 Tax=Silene latifolia TaxID=37657 RepID=UPI003D76F739
MLTDPIEDVFIPCADPDVQVVFVAIIYGEMDDDFTVARMLCSGVPLEEPYIQLRLHVLANEEKKRLKEGRLPIKDSFYLMGTVDPLECLKENEVCIIHDNGQISGNVFVYRYSEIHFGDIRVLKSTHQKVIEDTARNSKYRIFFSTEERSSADQMAGGDYDGDMYWVSSNPELLRVRWARLSSGEKMTVIHLFVENRGFVNAVGISIDVSKIATD